MMARIGVDGGWSNRMLAHLILRHGRLELAVLPHCRVPSQPIRTSGGTISLAVRNSPQAKAWL